MPRFRQFIFSTLIIVVGLMASGLCSAVLAAGQHNRHDMSALPAADHQPMNCPEHFVCCFQPKNTSDLPAVEQSASAPSILISEIGFGLTFTPTEIAFCPDPRVSPSGVTDVGSVVKRE